MMWIRVRRLVTAGLVALTTGCMQMYPPQERTSPAASPQRSTTAAAVDSAKSPFKKWDDVLKDTEKKSGFFDVHLKRDNTLYMEIAPDRLDRDFGLVMHFSRGVGVFNAHDGLPLSDTQLMRFVREGDKVYLVHRNPNFTADEGSAMRVSLDDNVGHSVVEDFAIESEHDETKALLINATGFFVSDYSGITNQIKIYYANKPVRVDDGRSWVDAVQAFPQNVEIDAALTLATTDAPTSFGARAGVSDYRSVPIGVRYSLFQLPEEPMQRRFADDRVGHFIDAQRDFSRDQDKDQYVRYVNRWRLEKKDHGQAVSEPVEPIVYYIDRSVPEKYHRWVKEGIEAWNKAYEAAGYRNAVVARVAPTVEEDPTWSAEDIRYSTVRWTAAHQMGYAIGPSQTDPRTGELLNADILISSTFTLGYFREWEQLSGPAALIEGMDRADMLRGMMDPTLAQYVCAYETGKNHQLQIQHAALTALGVIDGNAPLPEEYLGPALRELIMHEVGHTLGLRHNMKGSSAIPFERLDDVAYTSRNGLALSVMDYNAANINPDRDRQGEYYHSSVGAYDIWAIRYAHQPIYQDLGTNGLPMTGAPVGSAEAEVPGLMRIAGESADVLHTYGTDEDVGAGSWGVDPMSNTWDLSGDPLRWAEQRAELVRLVTPEMESRVIADGESYSRLRGAIGSLMGERWISLRTAVRMVGGVHHVRDHRGQPGERMPFTPVAAATQRKALDLVIDQAFEADAWEYEAEILNKMPPARFFDWSTPLNASGAVDFPVHQQVLVMQRRLLADLLNTARLTRMVDNAVRMPGGSEAFTVAELMGTLTSSIFSELGVAPRSPRNANSFRRNLQRTLIDGYVEVMMGERPSAAYPTPPEDARSLARYELRRLAERMETALGAGALDTVNAAHLEESIARIERALDASMNVEVG